MYPSRSSTVMSLRTVALDTPSLREPATRWDPTGSAVSTYSSTTARRIAALRSSRSIGSVDPMIQSIPSIPSFPSIPSIPSPRTGTRPARDADRPGARLLALDSTECQRRSCGCPSAHGALDQRRIARRDDAGRLLVGDREPDHRAVDPERGDARVRTEHTGRDRPLRARAAHQRPELVRPIGGQRPEIVLEEEPVAAGEEHDAGLERAVRRGEGHLVGARVA